MVSHHVVSPRTAGQTRKVDVRERGAGTTTGNCIPQQPPHCGPLREVVIYSLTVYEGRKKVTFLRFWVANATHRWRIFGYVDRLNAQAQWPHPDYRAAYSLQSRYFAPLLSHPIRIVATVITLLGEFVDMHTTHAHDTPQHVKRPRDPPQGRLLQCIYINVNLPPSRRPLFDCCKWPLRLLMEVRDIIDGEIYQAYAGSKREVAGAQRSSEEDRIAPTT